jgi:hypothetical protein
MARLENVEAREGRRSGACGLDRGTILKMKNSRWNSVGTPCFQSCLLVLFRSAPTSGFGF